RPGPIVMTNVALHALSAALLMLLLRRFGFGPGASAFGGLLFALHPAHVESYAWIAERKDVLSAALFLATLHAWRSWTERRARGAWVLALLLFALALLAKPMVVTLPAVLLLLEIWPGRRDALPLRRRIGETIPFFALAAVASAVTLYTQKMGGAVRSASLLTPLDRIENTLTSWSWSVRTWLAPRGLAVFHPARGHSAAEIALAVAILVLATAAAWAARRRAPAILVGWLWFLGMLFPVSGIVQVGLQQFADRYLYLPGIGLLIALLGAAAALAERFRSEAGGKLALQRAAALIAIFWLVALGVQSQGQFALWRSSEPLFRQAVRVHPDSGFAHYLLGRALIDVNRHTEAEASLRRAIEIHTGRTIRRGRVYDTWLPQAYVKLSESLRALGRAKEAIAPAEIATRLAPGDAPPWMELGDARAAAGRRDARDAWERALAIEPASFDAHLRLGTARGIDGDVAGSIRDLQTAVRLREESVEARVQLALSLVAAERLAEAVPQLDAARAIDRERANRYLEQTANLTPSPDTLERYIAFLRRRAVSIHGERGEGGSPQE
ncbi:MAG TPA: tetratricopeptide repeat protein, partial [Thermoanaerobaculia bacterium]|nr:tetratricopeptide repeat protein [Thermoanaerobaculia bacterium]